MSQPADHCCIIALFSGLGVRSLFHLIFLPFNFSPYFNCLIFISVYRVPPPLPGRVLHQKHECGRDAGQRGPGGLPGSSEERMAAWAPQRYQHHLSTGPWRPCAPAHQQPEGRVRILEAEPDLDHNFTVLNTWNAFSYLKNKNYSFSLQKSAASYFFNTDVDFV